MSEFKEKVLSEISFAMVDDAPDLQNLYGKVAAIDEQPQLNENQKIVLERLKSETILTREAPILSVNAFSDKNLLGKLPNKVRKAYKLLDCKQEYEVLAAFAQWGLEQEE